MDYGISGKVALVTGAAGGIGSATARLFAQAGVAVALFDRDGDGARQVAADLAAGCAHDRRRLRRA